MVHSARKAPVVETPRASQSTAILFEALVLQMNMSRWSIKNCSAETFLGVALWV